MDMFIVHGGAQLTGSVNVSGSKNATLPIMAASLLIPGPVELTNVPDLVDVRTLWQVLTSLGAQIDRKSCGTLQIEVTDHQSNIADYDLVRRMRASVCVLGPLLARRGNACVSLPGGCNIGTRPIDLHLKGLAALGAEIQVRNGYVYAQASRLRGARIYLAGPCGSTVTGTCNVMSAATLAQGTTVIEAAACEPEVVALAEFLNSAGARITGHGTSQIVIDGVEELHPTRFEIIPDRIEAATLLIAAAATRSSLQLNKVNPLHLSSVIDTLGSLGTSIRASGPDALTIQANAPLTHLDVTALPYPGIPTDLQAQLMALACTLPGTSVIRDLVFPDRFMHVAELTRMGAQIRQHGSTAIVTGNDRMSGTSVMACDLRASAALVIAGLAAEGETIVRRIYHLDRGYEALEAKLQQLGAQVARVNEQESMLNTGSSSSSPDVLLPFKKTA